MNLCLEFYFPVTQARVLSAMFSVRAPFPRCGPDSVPERASPEGQNSADMIVFSQMPPVRHTAPRHSFSDAAGTSLSNGELVPSDWTTATSVTPVLVESAAVHKSQQVYS